MRMKSQLSLIISFQVETSLTIVLFLLLSSYYYATMISAEQGRKYGQRRSHKQHECVFQKLLLYFSLSAFSISAAFKTWCLLCFPQTLLLPDLSHTIEIQKAAFRQKLQPGSLNAAEHFLPLSSRRGHCELDCGAFFPPLKLQAPSAQNLIASFLNPLKNIDSWKRCTF